MKDELVRLRKLLTRRHQAANRKVLKLSAADVRNENDDSREERLRKEGEKSGLCFALKALDKICQTELAL